MAKKVLGYVELEWICPNCQTKNKGSQRACVNCGAPQPQDVEFQQVQGAQLVQDESVEEAVSAGADIHCAFCGARNPASATECSQCGADLSQGKARQAGKILGAYNAEAADEIACPHCGSLNPAAAERCQQCGGSLPQSQPSVNIPPSISQPKFTFKPIMAVGALALLLLCGLLAWWISASMRTEAVTGALQGVQWQRAVVIEALAPVQHEAWKDEVPAQAHLGDCTPKQRRVSDDPQPQSTEVCGTPYTIDTGSGKGQVVQDCQYLVYDLFCKYTQKEWKKDTEAVLKGTDFNPVWPQPTLQSDQQRIGEKSETYALFFDVDGKTLRFQTSDPSLFEQARKNQRWLLHINSLGNIVSIEAAK